MSSSSKFVIEDRAAGEVVASGTVTQDGEVHFENSSLDSKHKRAFAKQISIDIEAGYSGGKLGENLEWFELLPN
ncbi:MAG: hypothetical protein KDI71_12165 [Xanthomonadales bacterium]|nr:hypothetical protein [Xanthomonadales bacterium]